MRLQFQKSTLPYLATAVQAVRNGEVTQELRLSDGMPDIGRVLTTWGQVILRGKEWEGNQLTVSGEVMTWTLYAPEDGTEPRPVEGRLPFQLKWETGEAERNGRVLVTPLLRFTDSRGVSSRKLMIRASVAVLAQGLCKAEAQVCVPEELSADIQTLHQTYPLQIPVEAGEKTFLLDEELQIPGMTQGEKLISYGVHPEITEKRVLSDKILLKGNGNLHLVYRDADGRIRCWNHELPFSQLAELDTMRQDEGTADIRMGVTSLEADLSDSGNLRLKCGLVAQYLVWERKMLDVIQDAYSPKRTVEPEMEELQIPVLLEDRTETVMAQQTIAGEQGEVADAVFYPDFPGQRKSADQIDLEPGGLFQTLVYGENGVLQGSHSRWEGGLSLPAGENTQIAAVRLYPGQVQTGSGAEGVQLKSSVRMDLQTSSLQQIPMVSALEIGEEQEPDVNKPSLILCRPEGENLWNLAKVHGSTVAAIRAANGLEGEPNWDQMLLIPVS